MARRPDTVITKPVGKRNVSADRACIIVRSALSKELPMTPRRFAEVVAHSLTVSNLTHRDLASTCGLSTVTI